MITTSSSTHNRSSKATILVVEDNTDQWILIRWALQQRFPEVEAIWLSDATQVVAYLETCTQHRDELPRLVLLDLYLPRRQHGWNLLQLLKTHYAYREIPVIVLSHSVNAEDISESYALRGNSYIVKPTNRENWLDCISSLRQYWWDAVTLPKYS